MAWPGEYYPLAFAGRDSAPTLDAGVLQQARRINVKAAETVTAVSGSSRNVVRIPFGMSVQLAGIPKTPEKSLFEQLWRVI